MPTEQEWREAINWALSQQIVTEEDIVVKVKDEKGEINCSLLVDKVSEYFNAHNIKYRTFDFYALEPFLSDIVY